MAYSYHALAVIIAEIYSSNRSLVNLGTWIKAETLLKLWWSAIVAIVFKLSSAEASCSVAKVTSSSDLKSVVHAILFIVLIKVSVAAPSGSSSIAPIVAELLACTTSSPEILSSLVSTKNV